MLGRHDWPESDASSQPPPSNAFLLHHPVSPYTGASRGSQEEKHGSIRKSERKKREKEHPNHVLWSAGNGKVQPGKQSRLLKLLWCDLLLLTCLA
jgi:hypothetical protein